MHENLGIEVRYLVYTGYFSGADVCKECALLEA